MTGSTPADMINLRLILVSGKTKEFLFSPNDSAADIAKHVYDNWPMVLSSFGSAQCSSRTTDLNPVRPRAGTQSAPTPSAKLETNIWWPDAAAVQLPPLFSLSFNAFTFVCSSSQATPRVLLLLSCFLTFSSASRRAHILYILHIMI
ncbi:ubiquitin-like protein 3a isoform X1 [Epinephelus fuscoguttatus]|uniref:ubiquitin-like protein 3a isoform X1 n=1 Tax=Epinephelus fuscoguttatus TaxID=293821 RepID=UPI0020CFFCB5|nr:ubiquitin-like protein 3a isoform X1 [Epinephelus fuscoguttatus]